jgi:hypothetical protein
MAAFALEAIADWRSDRLRFGVLPDSKWPAKALFLFTFHAPVKLKRFLDELCDFNLGIFVLLVCLFYLRMKYDHLDAC